MRSRVTSRDWLPLAKTSERPATELPTGEAFRPSWLDFERGIRVGNLEPHERITQIVKHRLEEAWTTPFVVDRWGRGVYWQIIFWVPRENRQAKPLSSDVNFGSAKYFISLDKTLRVFQFGLTVERGYLRGRTPFAGIRLKKDWDWHRLMAGCGKGTSLDEELTRLVRREGFCARIGGEPSVSLGAANFRSAAQLRTAAGKTSPGAWAGFDLFYPMPEAELRAATGWEIVQAVLGGFTELVPFMNMCMQVPLTPRT